METQGTRYTLRGLILSLFFAATANAQIMVNSWQNRTGSAPGLVIAPKATYFSSTQNFNSLSQAVLLNNNISIQRFYFDLNMSYGFDENLFLFGRLSGLYTTLSGTGVSNQNSFGLNDQMVGAAYRLFQNNNGVSLNLQGEINLPAYSNADAVTNSKPFMGDGSTDFTIGGFAEIPLTIQSTYSLYLDGGAGYMYRSKGYSAGIPYSVWLKRYPTQSGLIAGLGMRGNVSLETDVTPAATAALDQNRGAGGSYIIGAVNPSWMYGQFQLGYQNSSNMQYVVSAAVPFTGTNAANGLQLSAGIQFELGGGHSKKKSSIVRPGAFKQYDLEAKVVTTMDQLYLVKIDKGTNDGVEKGQIFDIFIDNQAIAKARVQNVKDDESALRVLEYYQEQSIEVDAVAKRIVQ